MSLYTSSSFLDNRIAWEGRKDFGDAQVGLHYIQGRFPIWFEKDAWKFGEERWRDRMDKKGAIQALIDEYNQPPWMDHIGLLRMNKEIMGNSEGNEHNQVLIVEPYGLYHSCISQIMRMAEDLHLRVQIEAAGSHYPTHTLRIYLFKQL